MTFENDHHAKDSTRHTDATKTGYVKGRDNGFGVFVPGIKTTKQNGATRCIPGSHLWGDDHGADKNSPDVVYAELEVGEAFFMLASTFHAGSTNFTQDENRIMVRKIWAAKPLL